MVVARSVFVLAIAIAIADNQGFRAIDALEAPGSSV
jgi:hypothetical protein